MKDEEFKEITDYLEANKQQSEALEGVAEMLASLFNALVERGVSEQYAVGMTMSYFWTLMQRGK